MAGLSSLQVFQDEIYTSATELVAQQVDKFNAASNGMITLITGAQNQGDFTKSAMYKKISGLVRRRDPYDRSSTVTAKDIEHLLKVSAKVASGTPPVNVDPDTLAWIQRAPDEFAQVIAAQLAEDQMQDMLNTAIIAFITATRGFDNASTLIHNGTTGANGGTLSLSMLNSGAAKFGDRMQALRGWIMHSYSASQLYGAAIANSNQLFQFGTMQIREDGFGRPLIITDSDNLVNAGSPEGYYVCGLVQGGVAVEQNNDFIQNIETSNGKENISRTWQAEWSYNVGVKGYKWNVSVAAPTNAELATEANWTAIATSKKDTAGVLVIHD